MGKLSTKAGDNLCAASDGCRHEVEVIRYQSRCCSRNTNPIRFPSFRRTGTHSECPTRRDQESQSSRKPVPNAFLDGFPVFKTSLAFANQAFVLIQQFFVPLRNRNIFLI